MGLLTKVEEILNIPMDLFHRRKGFHPVDINRMVVRSMEQGCRRGINKMYAPNFYRVMLHPLDYRDLYPFLRMIRDDARAELQRLADERGYLLAAALHVEIIEDKSVPEGVPRIKGLTRSENEPGSMAAARPQKKPVPKKPSQKAKVKKQETRSRGTRANSTVMEDEPMTILRESITMLKEGDAETAMELLTVIDEQRVEEVPQYHAAMGVACGMRGRADEAKEHFARLAALEAPARPVPLLTAQSAPTVGANSPTGALETNIPGVSLHFGVNGFFLENRYQDPSVAVNGRVAPSIKLENDHILMLGEMRMVVKLQGEGNDNG